MACCVNHDLEMCGVENGPDLECVCRLGGRNKPNEIPA